VSTFAGWLSPRALDDATMTMRSSGALEGVTSLTLGLLPYQLLQNEMVVPFLRIGPGLVLSELTLDSDRGKKI